MNVVTLKTNFPNSKWIVDCGAPVPPTNGSVHYTGTREGSRAVTQCGAGLALQGGREAVSVCGSNGLWVPDTGSLMCVHNTNTAGQIFP